MLNFDNVISLIKQTRGMFQRNSYEVTVKGKFDYATQVDFEIQEFIKSGLAALDPGISFLAEEQDNGGLDGEKPMWILDPVDGTTNLMHNFRHSAVSLALNCGGKIEFGAVYNPFTGEMFTAQKSRGACLNGESIHVTGANTIDKSLVAFGTSPYEKRDSYADFELYHRVFTQCHDIRRTGAAALDLCYVASGRVDAFFEKSLKPWDFAAGSLILEEAGGRITDWGGSALGYMQKSSILATNGLLHEWFLDILK